MIGDNLVVCLIQLESLEDNLQHQLSEQDKQWRKKVDQVVKQHKNQILKVRPRFIFDDEILLLCTEKLHCVSKKVPTFKLINNFIRFPAVQKFRKSVKI